MGKKRIKWDIEKSRKVFKEAGLTLLEEEYTNYTTKMNYICDTCEYFSKIDLCHLIQRKRCPECAKKKIVYNRKYYYEDIKNIFEDRNCILLTKKNEYVHSKQKLKYLCSCGNPEVEEILLGNFMKGHKCSVCGRRINYTYEEVEKMFEDKGFKILQDFYKDNRTKIKYRCICKNKSTITLNSLLSGGKCSECKSKNRMGENNGNYNPNLTDEERKKGRRCRGYKKWIRKVRERDNDTCQICGEIEGILCAHHIEAYKPNKELRTVVSNGILMCEKDHKKFHKEYGNNCNREQLNEFVKNKRKISILIS